jgi:hypothetical protein
VTFPPSKTLKSSRPLVMHHLMLLQGAQFAWIGRSALALDRNVWSGEPKRTLAEPADPLLAAADLFEQTPRGRIKRADKLTVLLGYPYVKHTVLPWQAGLSESTDWQSYANAVFDAQDGAVNLRRQVVVDPAPFGQPRLAAAADATLIEGLQALARLHKLRLASCMSLLTAAVQQHWDLLEDDCVLSLPQPDALECLFRKQGAWQGVCGIPVAPDAELVDSVAAATMRNKATVATESTVPLLVATPFLSALGHAQDKIHSVRWLGPAHPWLATSSSGHGRLSSLASGFAPAGPAAVAVGPGPSVAASAPLQGGAGSDGGHYKWGYWAADNLMTEQSGRYGAWGKQTWRHALRCSAFSVIYFKPRPPFSRWKKGSQ